MSSCETMRSVVRSFWPESDPRVIYYLIITSEVQLVVYSLLFSWVVLLVVFCNGLIPPGHPESLNEWPNIDQSSAVGTKIRVINVVLNVHSISNTFHSMGWQEFIMARSHFTSASSSVFQRLIGAYDPYPFVRPGHTNRFAFEVTCFGVVSEMLRPQKIAKVTTYRRTYVHTHEPLDSFKV